MNSSVKVSPMAGAGMRLLIAFSPLLLVSSVIIDNFNIEEVVAFDLKANPVLIIDPNHLIMYIYCFCGR